MDKFKTAGKMLNKGAALLAAGKTNESIKAFLKAIKTDKQMAAAYFDLALAFQQKGENQKAIAPLETTVKLRPNDFEALNLLGHLYMLQEKIDAALICFQKAVTVNPLLTEGYYNLGVCYMKKGLFAKAIKSYNTSLKLFPNNSIVFNNIGVTFEDMGKPKEALAYFKKAVKINPQNSMALANIGATLIYNYPLKAAEYFKKALDANPNMDSAAFNLGVSLRLLGDAENSIKYFEKALEINPASAPTYGQLYHQVRDVCDWKRARELESKMRKLTTKELSQGAIPAETIFVSVVYDDNPKRNFQIAKAWSNYIENKVAPFYKPYSFADRKKEKGRIRIGYLSNDFKNHATAHLIIGLFRLHNRSQFDIYTYSYGENDKSVYRKEIEKITKFRDVRNLTFSQTADLIYKDKIDILVDLKGHTTNCRMEIPALKPAPIQIHYLGFPGTTGAKFIDYFVSDKVVTPKSHIPYFSEKLIFLPNSYQVNDNKQPISKKAISRGDLMLPEAAFLFCCYNQPYKIDPDVFDSWIKILKAVPGSAFCLLAKNNTQITNLINEAKKRGIDPRRLIFSLSLVKDVHLARLSLCDLALDTFICNGHTSTSDALWAGLPVITLKGKHFASRVSASLLSAIGLPELIVKSKADYEKLAISLATNPEKLAAVKEKLAKNRLTMPLFNTPKFVSNLEKAYEQMWRIYQTGVKPKQITIKD